MTAVILKPIGRAFYELIGVREVEERAEDTIRKHNALCGDVRDMRQRLDSLKRIVAAMRRGDPPDEPV